MNTTSSPTNYSAWNATAAVNPALQSPYITESGLVETFRLTFQVLLALTGFVGNILVILVITLQPKMKTVVNLLIRNLAIADICTVVFIFPYGVIKEQALYHWPLGEFVCRAVVPFLDVFYGVAIWSIVAVSIDRYNAIVCVKRPNKERALKRARYTMVVIWLVSFIVISLPLYIVMKLRDNSPEYVVCGAIWPDEVTSRVYHLGVFLYCYLIPVTVVIWTFLKISKKLHTSTKFNKRISRELCSDPDAASPKLRIRERQNSKAKSILIPVVVVFTVTMFPINAFRLAIMFKPQKVLSNRFFWVYYHISLTSVLANCAANFFIYSLVSKEFRQAFRQLFHRTGQRLSSLITSPVLSYRRRKAADQKTKSSIV